MTRRVLVAALDTIGSVPFGVALMVLVLAYCWIGSAPLGHWFVRQSFEKTEYQWFTWWPFDLLVGLLALALVLVTVRRIPMTLPNLGVWTVHAGILVIIAGSVVYFGSKREGDMAVYRRAAVLSVPGGAPARLVLKPGEAAAVSGTGRAYQVRVADLNPAYELLTGADRGTPAFAAQLEVVPVGAGGEPFVRQLIAGHPEYTEDVVPGKGRAIKVLGRRLVDDTLDARLEYAPEDRIYLNEHPSLNVRVAGGDRAWTEWPLRGLPRYHEFLSRPDDAFVVPGDTPRPLRRLDLRPRPRQSDPALDGITVRVTGFLPFAQPSTAWEPGGDEFNPYADVNLRAGTRSVQRVLLAKDPAAGRGLFGGALDARFEWVDSRARLDALLHPAPPRLVLEVPARRLSGALPLAAIMSRRTDVAQTGYTVEGVQYDPAAPLPSGDGTAPALIVRVGGPRRTFLRAIFAGHPDLEQDLDERGRPVPRVDDAVRLRIDDAVRPGLVIVGGTQGGFALLVSEGGGVLQRPLDPGRTATFLGGALEVTLNGSGPAARAVERPLIVPDRERDNKAREAYSMVQVEIARAGQVRRAWLPYSPYPYATQMGYFPRTVSVPGSPPLELLYTRESLQLPSSVALDDFRLVTYPGGERERDYVSIVRFGSPGAWGAPEEIHSNHPMEHAGWWFFQATWDPPDPSTGSRGMSFTGLGVGNQHGVGVLLAGSILTVLGTGWAFYVKPALVRRRSAVRTAPVRLPAGAEPVAVRARK